MIGNFPIMNIEEYSQVTFLSIFQILLPMLDTIERPQPNSTFPEALVIVEKCSRVYKAQKKSGVFKKSVAAVFPLPTHYQCCNLTGLWYR